MTKKPSAQKKGKHGGRRPGAGRPETLDSWKPTATFTLTETLIERLQSVSNRSALIRKLLTEYFETLDSTTGEK